MNVFKKKNRLYEYTEEEKQGAVSAPEDFICSVLISHFNHCFKKTGKLLLLNKIYRKL